MLHGAGIYTYKTGSFIGAILVNIPAPWFAFGYRYPFISIYDIEDILFIWIYIYIYAHIHEVYTYIHMYNNNNKNNNDNDNSNDKK